MRHKNLRMKEKKKSFVSGDFNLNCLNCNEDRNKIHFYHKTLGHGFIPLIEKPSRVCQSSVTIIENILNHCIFDNALKKTVIKSDI